MQCEEVRELLSAVVDGEATAREQAIVDAHLATCAECQAWQERAHTLVRWSRIRSSGAEAEPDAEWLAALGGVVSPRRRGPHIRLDQAVLAVTAGALLLLTIPLIVSGRVDDVRDVAALEAAIGVALVVVLLQPWRAPGVAAVAAPAGAALVTLELVAFGGGDGSPVDLVRHVAALVGGLAAWRLSRGLPPQAGREQIPGMSLGARFRRHGRGASTAARNPGGTVAMRERQEKAA
jgi:predicted anti-sigma-YlaC factor YlaD